MPRLAARQIHRQTMTPTATRITTENLFIFHCRKTSSLTWSNASHKMPYNVTTCAFCFLPLFIIPLLQRCNRFRGRTTATLLDGEMCIWKEKWKRESKEGHLLPETVLSVIDSCDLDLFPTIR
ncbi:hypothetical protein PR048_005263 [Dryococelus australis]|uniref:Uncharacterized protein n=1 Tax=Dryococelus australis TaxID=614101 RepID=A0ABQ9I7P8_9NEOP|nr:hypothetical protein PR048_005263 [Dryococelus australis]